MLISHPYKFIFLKTVKTASTTTEIFFEKYCVPKDYPYKEEHYRKAIITKTGIIGSRGSIKDEFFHHMSCDILQEKIGDDIFNKYFKFANVRNPFDILVSEYFFFRNPAKETFEEYVLSLDDIEDSRSFGVIFANKKLQVDDVIRYENLNQEIRRIAKMLKIKDDVILGNYKSEYRKEKGNYRKYYNAETKLMVEKIYKTYLDVFNYQF